MGLVANAVEVGASPVCKGGDGKVVTGDAAVKVEQAAANGIGCLLKGGCSCPGIGAERRGFARRRRGDGYILCVGFIEGVCMGCAEKDEPDDPAVLGDREGDRHGVGISRLRFLGGG